MGELNAPTKRSKLLPENAYTKLEPGTEYKPIVAPDDLRPEVTRFSVVIGLVMTVVFALIILILVFIPWFDNPESAIGKYHLIILVSVIYVAINWINYMKRPILCLGIE